MKKHNTTNKVVGKGILIVHLDHEFSQTSTANKYEILLQDF